MGEELEFARIEIESVSEPHKKPSLASGGKEVRRNTLGVGGQRPFQLLRHFSILDVQEDRH